MDSNLLLSFPRSGNTWIRYILEFISRSPTSMGSLLDCQEGVEKTDTVGVLGVDVSQKCIAIKRHRADNHWDNWQPENTKLILLVRHYQEACLRHLTLEQRKHTQEIQKCVEGYIHCLKFYDEFQGKKILVYYEDIISTPRETIDNIIDFLEIEKGKYYQEFWENYNQHKENSIKNYVPGSATLGLKTNNYLHSRRSPARIKDTISKLIKQESKLFDKYLTRYHG